MQDLKKISTFSADIVSEPEPLNETMSRARVRLFYRGLNRNQSFITDEFAEKLLKTLPYTPVCGIYNKAEGDFEGHLTTEDEDSFPYGVVPADMNLRWERHLDSDGVERTYACSDVILWTEKYQHAKEICGKGQSMELFVKSIEGEWVTAPNGEEMFVYSKGCFVGLQALGDKVTPCFEGAEFYSLKTGSAALKGKEAEKFAEEVIKELKNYNLSVKNDINNEKEGFQMDEKELEVVTEAPKTSEVVVDPLETLNDKPVEQKAENLPTPAEAEAQGECPIQKGEEVKEELATPEEKFSESTPATEMSTEPTEAACEEGKVEEGEMEPAPVNAVCGDEEKKGEAPADNACGDKEDEEEKDEKDDLDDYQARYETLKTAYDALVAESYELREVFLNKYSGRLDEDTMEEFKSKIKDENFSLAQLKADIGTKLVEKEEYTNNFENHSDYILNLDQPERKLSGAARIIKKHITGGNK